MHSAHSRHALRPQPQRAVSGRRSAVRTSASLHTSLQHADNQQRSLHAVSTFLNRWHKGDIAGLQQLLTKDCLVLEPLWAVPGAKGVLSGIDEVAWFRRHFCRATEYTKFDVLNVASTPGSEEEHVYLQFRESNSRTPAVWEVVQRAIRTRLLFPLTQTDEAGVIMFTIRTDDCRIKEIVCLRKPPQAEDICDKVLQDDYYSGAGARKEAAPPRYLTLFDRM